MANSEHLQSRFPALCRQLSKVQLTSLPTAVRETRFLHNEKSHSVWIKEDNLTGEPYGGNKVRKLEYLLGAVVKKHRDCVATFGAVGSHHALATALYAKKMGLGSISFLSHQTNVAAIPTTLNTQLKIGTRVVRYGGTRSQRITTLRKHLKDQNAWVIPAGGSSWLGTVAFVEAGLELADQIAHADLPMPDRLYVATGTMSTAAGLALGLALAESPVTIHAVRVSHTSIANRTVLDRLMKKTTTMLARLDSNFPTDLANRTNIILRDEYFGGGYAHSNAATDRAIAVARDQFDLSLETTYTGKAMAALLEDLSAPGNEHLKVIFWNTYHSKPLDVASEEPLDNTLLPAEFLRYFPG